MLNRINNFFWFCAGANKDILDRNPTEQAKYTSIGATVFLTGIFASISAGYAIYFVFSGSDYAAFAATIVGIIWGLTIFNLDRFLVISIEKTGIVWQELKMATPRLFLAILIGVVIARPLELRIFEKEINEELKKYYLEKLNNLQAKRSDIFDTQFSTEFKLLKEHKEKQKKVDTEYKTAIDVWAAECTGKQVSGQITTGKFGKGIICEDRRVLLDIKFKEKCELDTMVTRQEKFILEKRKTSGLTDVNKIDSTTINYNVKNAGFLDRNKMLSKLSSWTPFTYWDNDESENTELIPSKDTVTQDSSKATINKTNTESNPITKFMEKNKDKAVFFISLLFILIECMPILVKIMSKRGLYDIELAKVNREKKNLLREEYKINKMVANSIAAAQREIIKDALNKYKETEKDRIENEPEAYRDYFSNDNNT